MSSPETNPLASEMEKNPRRFFPLLLAIIGLMFLLIVIYACLQLVQEPLVPGKPTPIATRVPTPAATHAPPTSTPIPFTPTPVPPTATPQPPRPTYHFSDEQIGFLISENTPMPIYSIEK